MCGLVGVVTNASNGFSKEQKDIFSNLLFLDMLRGEDSTGAFCVSNRGNLALAKQASNAVDFMSQKEYTDLMQKAWTSGAALIGHNRKATRGNITDANAHPFVVDDNIVLVHNGGMYGDHKKHADVEVDSHAIAHLIHEKGSVEEALGAFYGAYALIWYDVAEKQLNFVRNKERPLHWMEIDNAMVWASEEAMLNFVSDRFNLRYRGKEPVVYQLPDDTLVTLTLKNGNWDRETTNLKIVREVPKSTSQVWQNGAYWAGDGPTTRRHPYHYANGYYGEYDHLDADDEVLRPAVNTKDDVPSKNTDGRGGIPQDKDVARRLNKIVKYRDLDRTMREYPQRSFHYCGAIDYEYVNNKDDKDGFWLYLSLYDDDNVLVRHKVVGNGWNEERLMAACAGEYCYNITVDWKTWTSFTEGATGPEQEGVMVLGSATLCLVQGGGVYHEDFKDLVGT